MISSRARKRQRTRSLPKINAVIKDGENPLEDCRDQLNK
jgi:hypothetical protein